ERGGDARAVWRAYYRALSEMISAGGFDILGHFDLVRKNNKGGLYFDEEDPLYLSAAIGAARLLKGRDVVVEVNVGGMARGKTSTPYPSLPIMKELHSLGVSITFSADAHAVAHLGACLDAARELAAAAGYASVAVLSGGSWREVGLADT
ncbi:MAG: histidinol-phosphatase, partial [Spirochaetaceae bacterium]|nr:histidinol-phosphatase [Spirochaetaceae bacterium]